MMSFYHGMIMSPLQSLGKLKTMPHFYYLSYIKVFLLLDVSPKNRESTSHLTKKKKKNCTIKVDCVPKLQGMKSLIR